ncbi:MAG: RNA polymerase sigma factor [Acidobacteria bacterium]|nr:RNA polymerase sigma factor [Acidobacteriota bacterium]
MTSGAGDDARLVRRMRRGDEAAFATLFAAHHAAIHRYALQMCGLAAADDVVQEVFLALLRQSHRYDPARGAVLTYLYGIARHHVLKRLPASGVESALDDDDHRTAVPATALDDLSRGETVDRVRQAVQSLPPAYREVVVLCELHEMDYETAASILECPIGTVRSRLHRARRLLMTKLAAVQRALVGESRG